MKKFCQSLAVILLIFGSMAASAGPPADADNKIVIGPRNPDLTNGAQALLAGDVEEGIRLTRLGLSAAVGRREKVAALSNLCAGYVMLDDYETGFGFCNQALEINARAWRALSNRSLIYIHRGEYDDARADLLAAEAIAPHSTVLKEVRGILLDATDPVEPNIVIDDRRDTGNKNEG